MKVRKRPVVVDAVEFRLDNEQEVRDFLGAAPMMGGPASFPAREIHIHTLEGTMIAQLGDYIIRGVKGEYYPCKPDIFLATYEVIG